MPEQKLGTPAVDLSASEREVAIIDRTDDDDDSDELNDLEDHEAQVNTGIGGSGSRRLERSRSRSGSPNSGSSNKRLSSRFRRTAKAERSGGSGGNSGADGGNSGGLWASRRAEDNVDQSVNLMSMDNIHEGIDGSGTSTGGGDGGRGRQRSRARPSMASSRPQKSMVDIFLSDDRPQSRGGAGGADYGITDLSRDGRNRKCRNLFVFVATLVFIATLFVTVPQFGMVSILSGTDNDNNSNDNNSEQSETLFPTTGTLFPTTQEEEDEVKGEAEIVEEPPAQEDEDTTTLDIEDVPQTTKLAALEFYVLDQDITDEAQLDIQGSPVKKALHWISQNDPAQLEIPGYENTDASNIDAERALLQRYALAVFYYSVQAGGGGASPDNEGRLRRRHLQQNSPTDQEWTNRARFDDEWLSAEHVCAWPGITCADAEYVTEIILPEHALFGTIPRELLVGGAMPFLTLLDLSYNYLQGTFPLISQERAQAGAESGVKPAEPALQILRLTQNQLTGYLDHLMGLKASQEVDIRQNQFQGPIPDEVMYLTNLQQFRAQENELSGYLPGESLGGLTDITVLELDKNTFLGEIPIMMYSMTNLQKLHLSNNGFQDQIPDILGDMTNLESLNLEYNELVGQVPTELGKLTKLERFLMGRNQLTGEVPQDVCDLRPDPLKTLVSDCTSGDITCSCCTQCV